MRMWAHLAVPSCRQSTAHLRLRAVMIFLALASLELVLFGVPSVAQATRPDAPGAPPGDDSYIPKPIADTFDRVFIRNASPDAQTTPKTASKEETCFLPPLALLHSALVTAPALQVPASVVREYQNACSALKRKKTADAEKHLRKAVQDYPKYSAAWVTLGQVLAAQQRIEDARSACSQAATADPTSVPAHLCLADIAAHVHDWGEVLKQSRRALELDPVNIAIAYEYHAAASLHSGKLNEAEEDALRAAEIDTEHREPRVHFVLAQIYEAKDDSVREAEELREYLKYATNPGDIITVKEYLARLNLEAADDTAQLSRNRSRGPVWPWARTWGPADVDDAIPPVLNDGSCPLPEILKTASRRTQYLIESLQRFSAKEHIAEVETDKNGNRSSTTEVANYVAEIKENSSGYPGVTEYRSASVGSRRASLTDTGTAALALLFHPAHVGTFDFRCEGLTQLQGASAWQLHFEEGADPNKAFTAIRVGGAVYLPRFKGRAWIAANTYDVLQIETDLMTPIPEIDLQMEHMMIRYVPVEFRERRTQLWLPESVSLHIAYRGHHYERMHSFNEFQLFSVDTAEAVSEPPSCKN